MAAPDSAFLTKLKQGKRGCLRLGSEDEDPDFFSQFASVRTKYELSKRKTVERYRLSRKISVGPVANSLWPTLAGTSVSELYTEVLFDIMHSFKSKEKLMIAGQGLIDHLQKVFHIDQPKHFELFEEAIRKQAPARVLNLEIIEAKGLIGQDANGLSDPFCTLYISQDEKYETSVQSETLLPVWHEYFSLPIKSVQDDVLHVEVWDYDNPDETLSDKFKKIGNVSSSRGFRSFIKEIASSPTAKDRNPNDLHGQAKVPLQSIPTDNFDAWFPLKRRRSSLASRSGDEEITGQIRLRMTIGAEKDRNIASQEYRHVLYVLLIHELNTNSGLRYTWDGQFEATESSTILSRLEHHGGLLPRDINLAKWLVYTQVQCTYPLDTRIFAPLFLSVVDHFKKGLMSSADIERFWSASKMLVENFALFVQNIHDIFMNSFHEVTQSHQILQTCALLIDLLRSCVQSELTNDIDFTTDFILDAMRHAISTGASELFASIWEKNVEEEPDLRTIITLGQILMADLQHGIDQLQRHFQALLGIDYYEITYKVYDQKYGQVVEKMVTKICGSLKPLDLYNSAAAAGAAPPEEKEEENEEDEDISTKTILFELYLALKQFSDLSSTLKSKEGLQVEGNFHFWFYSSVNHWLDIAWNKARKRIQSAIYLDDLCPLYESCLLTSSAVDSAQIFHQIMVTWNQLSWPDVNSSSALVAKIMDDLCNCVMYYAEIIDKKLKSIEAALAKTGKVTSQICFVINNIEHLGLQMTPITEQLKLEQLFQDLETQNGALCSERYRASLDTIIENAGANFGAKIKQIIAQIWAKMQPKVYQLFTQIVEPSLKPSEKDDLMEQLMTSLDKNFIKLRDTLTETAFGKVLAFAWESILKMLWDLATKSVEKKRPSCSFKTIDHLKENVINFFHPDGVPEESIEIIGEIEELILIYGATTSELILKFLQERSLGHLKSTADFGSIALCVAYCPDVKTLRIEVLNCRNLKSTDSNGLSDPFVKIRLAPSELYPEMTCVKTKVQKNTLFPLFDEEFEIPLTKQQKELGGFIHVTVKDHDMIGRNDFVGEALISLKTIPEGNSTQKLYQFPQLHLDLTAPGDSNILKTLEHRPNDKIANDFAKKQRRRIVP